MLWRSCCHYCSLIQMFLWCVLPSLQICQQTVLFCCTVCFFVFYHLFFRTSLIPSWKSNVFHDMKEHYFNSLFINSDCGTTLWFKKKNMVPSCMFSFWLLVLLFLVVQKTANVFQLALLLLWKLALLLLWELALLLWYMEIMSKTNMWVTS